MRKLHGWAAAAVLAAVAGMSGAAPDKPAPPPDKPSATADKPPAPPDKPEPKEPTIVHEQPAAKDKDKPATIPARVAAETKLTEEEVKKVLKALGPAVRDQLAAGKSVELQGLGSLRVVRVAGHRDLVNGRPATIPAGNYVEFTPTGGLVEAANAADAVPADTVLPFEYNPLPGQTPATHVPDERMPNVRTR